MAKKERQLVEVKSDLPPVWEPAEGDVLEGLFIGSKRISSGKLARSFLTHQIQDEETGEVSSFAGAIADRTMLRVRRGAFVRVTYMGKIATQNGKAKNYKIELEQGEELAPESYEQDETGHEDNSPRARGREAART